MKHHRLKGAYLVICFSVVLDIKFFYVTLALGPVKDRSHPLISTQVKHRSSFMSLSSKESSYCLYNTDLVVVVDSSVSNYFDSRYTNFVKPMIDYTLSRISMDPDITRVALLTFATSYSLIFDFESPEATDSDLARQAVQALPAATGQAEMHIGLQEAFRLFDTQARPDAYKRMLFIIDGPPRSDGFTEQQLIELTRQEAARLLTLDNFQSFVVAHATAIQPGPQEVAKAVLNCSESDTVNCDGYIYTASPLFPTPAPAEFVAFCDSICESTPQPVPPTTSTTTESTTAANTTTTLAAPTTTTNSTTTKAEPVPVGVVAGSVVAGVAVASAGGAGAYYFTSSGGASVAGSIQEVKDTFTSQTERPSGADAQAVDQLIDTENLFEQADIEPV